MRQKRSEIPSVFSCFFLWQTLICDYMRYTTRSAEETRNIGTAFARCLRGGEILCLQGDLGAGKTTFTQGLLEALGAKGPFVSPTFLIMKEYSGKDNLTIRHIDAYRVHEQDMLMLGWEEFTRNPKTICIVEWPENIRALLPNSSVFVSFQRTGEFDRLVESTTTLLDDQQNMP